MVPLASGCLGFGTRLAKYRLLPVASIIPFALASDVQAGTDSCHSQELLALARRRAKDNCLQNNLVHYGLLSLIASAVQNYSASLGFLPLLPLFECAVCQVSTAEFDQLTTHS